MSTTLRRLESDDPRVGGVLITFDSGTQEVGHWTATDGPILPTLEAAKKYTAAIVYALQTEGREAELRDTNWVSVVAGIQALLGEFNDALRGSVPRETTSLH